MRSSSLRYIGCYRLSVLNSLNIQKVQMNDQVAVACAYIVRYAYVAQRHNGIVQRRPLCRHVVPSSQCRSCRLLPASRIPSTTHADETQPDGRREPINIVAHPSNITSPTLSGLHVRTMCIGCMPESRPVVAASRGATRDVS